MNSKVDNANYSKNILLLSFVTALLGIACSIFGYIFLPFAAGAFAALLLCEDKAKRIASYVVPVLVFVVNQVLHFLFSNFISLDGIMYVLLGLLIFVFYSKQKSKAECSFWTTLAVALSFLVSLILIAANDMKTFSLSAILTYYENIVAAIKENMLSELTSPKFVAVSEITGESFFLFSRASAEAIFNSAFSIMTALFIIFSFAISGISFKTFDAFRNKYETHSPDATEWKFSMPKLITFAFIGVFIFQLMFGGTDSVFSMFVTNLYYVLLAIYAYLGAKVIISAVSKNRSTFFAFLMIVLGFFLLGTTAAALLAVIGTYTTFAARVDTEKANKD